MIKELPRKGIATITNITNGILSHDHFPDSWKQAEMIVFDKAGKDVKLSQFLSCLR